MADEIALKFVVDFRAGVEFTPTRDESASWGVWECWLNCKSGELPNGTVGLVPTGDWLCWKSDEHDVQFGFADQNQAETFCVFNNGPGVQTRVVNPFEGDRASAITFETVAPAIQSQLDRLTVTAGA